MSFFCRQLHDLLSTEISVDLSGLSLKQGTGNRGIGEWENGSGERGTGNGESLKWGIFKSGNI